MAADGASANTRPACALPQLDARGRLWSCPFYTCGLPCAQCSGQAPRSAPDGAACRKASYCPAKLSLQLSTAKFMISRPRDVRHAAAPSAARSGSEGCPEPHDSRPGCRARDRAIARPRGYRADPMNRDIRAETRSLERGCMHMQFNSTTRPNAGTFVCALARTRALPARARAPRSWDASGRPDTSGRVRPGSS
jgi:hypothetical protein